MRHRNRYWLWDGPLWRDWLTYLTALGLASGISVTVNGYSNGRGFDVSGQELAFMIDLVIAVGFQFLLFGVIPGRIRRGLREREVDRAHQDADRDPGIDPPGEDQSARPAARAELRRRFRWVGLAVVPLIVLPAADWYLRNTEMDHLVRDIAVAERAEAKGRDQIDANRVSGNEPEPEDSRARLAAGDAVGPLSDAITRIEDVAVLPWHRGVSKARDRYLDHARTWEKFFNAFADNKDARDVDRQIVPTFSAAMRALRQAVPALPLYNLRRRVDDFEKD